MNRVQKTKKVKSSSSTIDANRGHNKDGKALKGIPAKTTREALKPVNTNTQPPPFVIVQAYTIGTDLTWACDDDDPYASADGPEIQYQDLIKGKGLRCRRKVYYGPGDEQRTCIWSRGDLFSWTEKSSGISWIGVSGTAASCVVAMKSDGKPLLHQLSSDDVLVTALCDIGVWADTTTPTTEFRRRMIAQSSSKDVGPFAVVSAASGTVVEDHLESTHGASLAINFLMKKLKGHSALTYNEIKQIAVCALKYLMGPRFDSNMVEARFLGKGDIWRGIFNADEVHEYLAAINHQT